MKINFSTIELKKYSLTYFYTQDGLIFTTFKENIFDEFKKFFPKEVAIFESKSNPEIDDKFNKYFETGIRKNDLKIDWEYLNLKGTLKLVLDHLYNVKIPLSYQKLAEAINLPNATRAVATAVGKNPIEVIIPCHLVVRKDGTIGNYRDGKEIKEFLLNLESKNNETL